MEKTRTYPSAPDIANIESSYEKSRVPISLGRLQIAQKGSLLLLLSNSFTWLDLHPPAAIISLCFLLNWHTYRKQGMGDTFIQSHLRVSLSIHAFFLQSHCWSWSFCLNEAVRISIPHVAIPSPQTQGPNTFWMGLPILVSQVMMVLSHPPEYTRCWYSSSVLNFPQYTRLECELQGSLDYLSQQANLRLTSSYTNKLASVAETTSFVPSLLQFRQQSSRLVQIVLRHLLEFKCQFWIWPDVLVVVKMLRVLKFQFSGLQLIQVKGDLLFSGDEIVETMAFFLTLNMRILPSRRANLEQLLPAAMQRSRGSNLMVVIFMSSSPSTKSGVTLMVEFGINLILHMIRVTPGSWQQGPSFFRSQVILYLNIIIISLWRNSAPQFRQWLSLMLIHHLHPSPNNVDLMQTQLEQKWLTSIQLTAQIPKQKPNSKHFAIFPGIFLLLSFCEKAKDPIYEIEFNSKPSLEWTVVKANQTILSSIGACLCFKTEPNMMSGPICDVDLLRIQRKSRFGQSKEVLNVPHSFKLLSHQLPFGYLIYRKVKGRIQQTFTAVLTEKYLSPKATRINLTQLPLFCFPEGIKIVREIRGFLTFNFIFTLETAQRIYVTCLIFKEQLDQAKKQKLEVFSNDQLFYEKALCLVSSQCYTDQFGECLQHLYRLSMSKSQVPFWKVIQTFINQMKMPIPSQIGDIGLTYSYGGIKVDFPTNNRYPFVSQRALYSIFKFMCIDKIISVFESLLLERKVIFVSQSKTILGYATQAFLGLLYPFKWEQVLIPILPENLKLYLTAPVPLVAGISPALVDSSIQSDSVIVYLDKNEVLNDEDNPPLPEKLFKQLSKRLEKLEIYDPAEVTEFLQNPESTYLFKMQEVQDPQFHGHLVRDIFFEFLLTFMKNYKKFLNKPKNIPKDHKDHGENSMMQFEESFMMTNIFKVQDFLNDLGMTKIGSFGYKFTESSIFTSFIERKFHSPNSPESLFFDDCIERKKNKKQAAFILPIKNKDYQIIKNPEPCAEEQGPFFYQNFPSLLKESAIKEQEIQLDIPNEKDQQNELISVIEEQYRISNDYFQGEECEDDITRKMLSLLLNKNKPKFQSENFQNKIFLYKWFIGFYEKQTNQIESILNEWPNVVCEQELITLKKYEYLRNERKAPKNSVVGVEDGSDYQMLQRNDTKILFVGSNHGNTSHKSSAIVVQILSYRVKCFINKIIPRQAGFLVDFCEKQASKDLRTSTLKKASEQTWNIETILHFKNWIHYEKEFGTAVTHD